jgi:hypothetical protein
MKKRIDHVNLLSENLKKLEKLNLAYGFILPPSTSGARIRPRTLSITLLSLDHVTIATPLDPSSLPLLRCLQLHAQLYHTIRLLLLQLSSLRVEYMGPQADFNLSIQESTSITSLSLNETRIVDLDDASKTLIKENIVEFRLLVIGYDHSGDSTLTTIITRSKAMKKVILDGVNLDVENQAKPRILSTLEVVKDACKTKGIELWKESFDVGNGKVDLEK